MVPLLSLVVYLFAFGPLGYPIGATALVLSIIGVNKTGFGRKRGRGVAVAGVVISALSFFATAYMQLR